MQLPAMVFTQIFLSRIVFSLKKTQTNTLNSSSLLQSGEAKTGPTSPDPSPLSSGQHERSRESESTLVIDNRKKSVDETSLETKRSQSMRKASSSNSQLRRPSADDASIAPTYQSGRRRSSGTLAPSPHPTGDYKFSTYSMAARPSEDVPRPPVPATPAPPFAAHSSRYQHHRMPYRNMPGGRFRRQSQTQVETAASSAAPDDGDDSHMSEAGDRVLEIRSTYPYTQAHAVYPYLFEPPGTANSSLPPPTGNSERANRSSGEFEYPHDLMPMPGPTPPTTAGSIEPVDRSARNDVSSLRQSYHTANLPSPDATTPPA